MEALILAAGRGTRIEHHSGGLPKTMLPIGGRPIIDHQLFLLYSAGVRKTTIVVGHQAERVRSMIREVAPAGMELRFVLNPFYAVTNTLGSFWLALPGLNEDLIYMNGDTIFDLPVLERLVSGAADITMAVDDHPCADEEMKVIVANGLITEVSKQVDPALTQGEFIGVSRFRKQVLPDLAHYFELALQAKGPNTYTEAGFETMIEHGCPLAPVDITGLFWNEIDFVEDLRRAEAAYPHSALAQLRR